MKVTHNFSLIRRCSIGAKVVLTCCDMQKGWLANQSVLVDLDPWRIVVAARGILHRTPTARLQNKDTIQYSNRHKHWSLIQCDYNFSLLITHSILRYFCIQNHFRTAIATRTLYCTELEFFELRYFHSDSTIQSGGNIIVSIIPYHSVCMHTGKYYSIMIIKV